MNKTASMIADEVLEKVALTRKLSSEFEYLTSDHRGNAIFKRPPTKQEYNVDKAQQRAVSTVMGGGVGGALGGSLGSMHSLPAAIGGALLGAGVGGGLGYLGGRWASPEPKEYWRGSDRWFRDHPEDLEAIGQEPL